MFNYNIATDPASSVVDLRFTDKEGKLIERRKVFIHPGEAEKFVITHMRDYLATRLRNYILHAWKLGTGSRSPQYSSTQRTNAITFLLDYLKRMPHENLFGVAYFVRLYIRELETVLPHPSNNSYPSSRRNLDEIQQIANSLKRQTNKSF